MFSGMDVYPTGVSVGSALAPTSVGIALKLLNEGKHLHSGLANLFCTAKLCKLDPPRLAPSTPPTNNFKHVAPTPLPLAPPAPYPLHIHSHTCSHMLVRLVDAGQTVVIAAFVDDIFSLIVLVILVNLSAGTPASPPRWSVAILVCFKML